MKDHLSSKLYQLSFLFYWVSNGSSALPNVWYYQFAKWFLKEHVLGLHKESVNYQMTVFVLNACFVLTIDPDIVAVWDDKTLRIKAMMSKPFNNILNHKPIWILSKMFLTGSARTLIWWIQKKILARDHWNWYSNTHLQVTRTDQV